MANLASGSKVGRQDTVKGAARFSRRVAGAAVAASLFASSSLPFAANAQTATAPTTTVAATSGEPDCVRKPGEYFTRSRCAVEGLKRSEQALRATEQSGACISKVTKEINYAKRRGALTESEKAEFRSRILACG
jgi:hypothetical protein